MRARFRSLAVLPWTLLVAFACTAEIDEHDGGSSRVGLDPSRFIPPDRLRRDARLVPAADLVRAADPKLPGFEAWPLSFEIRPRDLQVSTCRMAIERGRHRLLELEGRVREGTCVARWDGRGPGGDWLAPGPLRVEAAIETASGRELARTRANLELLRLGIETIQLRGERVPLLYPRMGGVREGFYAVPADRPPWRLGPDADEPTGATALEHAGGAPRRTPPIWDDLHSPPLDDRADDGAEHDTYNLPTAWVAGARPELVATLSADVAGDDPDGDAPSVQVRLVPPGGTRPVSDSTRFADERRVVLQASDSPVPAVGRYDWTLHWRFAVRRDAGEPWRTIPGTLSTEHRLYGLVDEPVFDYEGIPHRAWVDVVDRVTGWVDGGTADPEVVAEHIVKGVYFDLDLRYDTVRGASAYTSYPSGWDSGQFALSWFQQRAYGNTINCSDAASIVSTYANMVGIDFRYHILQHESAGGFDLNYIQAIGIDEFTERPFDNGGGGFSYHAVVGPPDGRIFDSTLAIDGDGAPKSLPASLLLAGGMMPDEYLRALSSQWKSIETHVDRKVRLR